MPYLKHILQYGFFAVMAPLFSAFFARTVIENTGFIFSIPAGQMLPLFPWVYGLCASLLYAIIFFQQNNHAPQKPFLLGFLALLASLLTLFVLFKIAPSDLVFILGVYSVTTCALFLRKKFKSTLRAATPPPDGVYFTLSPFKLCIVYLFTFSLFKYFWWYKNWQHIKQRDGSKLSPLFRSLFAVFYYENFLDDVNKTSEQHGVRGLKYSSALTSYYILLVIGALFITALTLAYRLLGLQLYRPSSTLVSTFNVAIFILAIIIYIAPQLAINRLNNKLFPHAPRKKMPVAMTIFTLIGLTLWFPVMTKLAFANRSNTSNAFILYDYGYYQSAYKKAAPQAYEGDAAAKLLLGKMYFYGKGVTQDNDQAERWLEDAAIHGNTEAQYLLGTFYEYGLNGIRDYKKTALWLQKAADQGHAFAANDLAGLYISGKGVKKDLQKALALYQQAAAKGDGYAMYNLGLYYVKDIPTPRYTIAASWFEKSIKARPNACAYNDLGMLYAAGRGVPHDTATAEKLLKQAGQQLLMEYADDIFNQASLTKDDEFTDPVPAFVQYQYAEASKKKLNNTEFEKKYPPATLRLAKNMSKKIAGMCWD